MASENGRSKTEWRPLDTVNCTKALVELVPGSDHNDSIPKIEIPDEKTESFGFSVNGISITVGRDISEEMLSKIMRAARNA